MRGGAVTVSGLDVPAGTRITVMGEAVPLGTYQNKDYFWETGEIVQSKTGPALIIPAFMITPENADDKRHWGYVAEKVWGVSSK